MLDRLFQALIHSPNEAADDVLLEALRIGSGDEQARVLDALLQRHTLRGLGGVIGRFSSLSAELQQRVLNNIRVFHAALRESARSDAASTRLAALELIAIGHQGKLAYILSENLHESDETLSLAATEALVALARWVATETRKFQNAHEAVGTEHDARASEDAGAYAELMNERPEIEAAVARAMDVHRGRHGQVLLRAGMLLCDWPDSKTLAILHTAKHGGQSPMIRRLQQPPASEHVEAFLLGASHGHLRSHFAVTFSNIREAPVLDALLRKTHWIKDQQLAVCLHSVNRGAWWTESDLAHDIERRTPEEAARIGEWLAASGANDGLQDERMDQLRLHAGASFAARLCLLRVAARRKPEASVALLKNFLDDPDERLVRMAAREIARRKPTDFENVLLRLMTSAPPSVRRVVSRSIGQAGFDHFWNKFDQLNKATRRQAGQAMLKILPDAIPLLQRRLDSGPVEQRLKAMQIAQELGLGESMRATLLQLCADPNPRLRSKAVLVAGTLASVGPEMLVERLLRDTDTRVRANTIEVLEDRRDARLVPVLAQRAQAAPNRERANAIKALHQMKVVNVSSQLLHMLRDNRSEHRISALWALRQIGWWQLLGEVGRLAKDDENVRVRRYALTVLKNVADLASRAKAAKAG